MSVSFTIDAVPVAFAVECMDGERRDERTWPHSDDGHRDCYEAADMHDVSCGCGDVGLLVTVYDIDTHEVNLANGNAGMVLARLGLDATDMVGTLDAEDFLGRVMVMGIGADDTGVATTTYLARGFDGATVHDCGLRPGYFADVEMRLAALATEAAILGRQVVWS